VDETAEAAIMRDQWLGRRYCIRCNGKIKKEDIGRRNLCDSCRIKARNVEAFTVSTGSLPGNTAFIVRTAIDYDGIPIDW